MRHHFLSSFISMAPSSLSPSKPTHKKPFSNPNPSPNCSNSSSLSLLCRHSPSATLDILILILVLISGTFLVSSYLSYIFRSLSLILPPLSLSSASTFILSLLRDSTFLYCLSFLLFFLVAVIAFEICCECGSRNCRKPGCKGLKKAMEFDLQLQSEECLRSAGKEVRDIEELPWKGGSEGNPDYDSLRAELRKMAPPNGRAVLLFRAKCGCPVAKLEGWGIKRGRRNKRSLVIITGLQELCVYWQ